MANVTVSVRLDPALLKELDAYLGKEGRTRSNLLSQIVRMWILAQRKTRKEPARA